MNSQISIETATQLSVFLGNRPGALSRVCAELADAEINIHALAISDTIDHAVVRMVVSDPTKALMILGERGVLALENDVLMIESNNEPGVLANDRRSSGQGRNQYRVCLPGDEPEVRPGADDSATLKRGKGTTRVARSLGARTEGGVAPSR